MDKKGGDQKAGDIGSVEMKSLCNDFSLYDCFRVLHKDKREFTWEGLSERGKVLCRLDRFYIDADIKMSLTGVNHVYVCSSISDHCCVNITLDMSKLSCKLGGGFWKCNTSVLHDLDLQQDIKNLWVTDLQGLKDISGVVWDNFKLNCKKIIKFHSKRIHTIKRQNFRKIQSEYRKYKILNDESGLYKQELQNLDSKLNQFLDDFIEGSKVRSKVNNLNFDEKPSRYFLNRERKKI